MNVAGKSVEDLLNISVDDFMKLTKPELRLVVSRLASAGNKRLKRFGSAGISSPAVRKVERSGGKFSTAGKDLNALRAEYVRAKAFFSSETSTRKGWEKVKKKTINDLKNRGVNIDSKGFDKFWTVYERLKEVNPEVSNKALKYVVMKEIGDLVVESNESTDDIVNQISDNLQRIYEEQEDLEMGSGANVSEFFEM